MPTLLPPQIFDRALHRRRLDRVAGKFAGVDFLKRRASQDLVERLEAVNRRFEIAVDLGARNGAFAKALALSPAVEKVGCLVQADLSPVMTARLAGPRLVADEERLPLAEHSCDLIVSALSLHWANDLVGALVQARRALRPDGLFLGAILGGATLTELRQALLEAEVELTGGSGPRVSPFVDSSDAGGLLQRAGFALPVADVDRLTVRYDHPMKLMSDLKAMGETNVLFDRPTRPLSRAVLMRACEIYAQRFSQDGRNTASFEIITLTGWAPHPAQQQPLKPGSARVRLADALSAVEQKSGDVAKP